MQNNWNDINLPRFGSSKESKEPPKKFITGVDDEQVEEPPEDEVRIISAEWFEGPKGFAYNEQCFVDVKIEYLKKTIRARITGQLFGYYDNQEFDLAQVVEGFIDDSTMIARMNIKNLWYPCHEHYYAWLKDKNTPCQYALKNIKHSRGANTIESPKLEMPSSAIIELEWEKRSIIAWDSSDKAEMKTKINVKHTQSSVADVEIEVYQYSADDNHILYKKFTGLCIESNVIYGPDSKEFLFSIEWHSTIYEYGKTQYFCKIITNTGDKCTDFSNAKLLQLKYYNSIIANPSGDLPGATAEGNWVYSYMIKYGPWFDAVENKLIVDGHGAKSYGSSETSHMKVLIERNKFIHHQSSHGTAYCTCDGTKNYVEDSGVAGADGQNNYWCPVCHTHNKTIGCIFLNDWNNLFFKEDVKKLSHSPKVLILANCCLTAITDTYAKAWLAKGTRWYIGWALPVGDNDAVSFAKAFYKRWMVKYKMESDKVRNAFNDVQGAYAQYRPRIFGR